MTHFRLRFVVGIVSYVVLILALVHCGGDVGVNSQEQRKSVCMEDCLSDTQPVPSLEADVAGTDVEDLGLTQETGFTDSGRGDTPDVESAIADSGLLKDVGAVDTGDAGMSDASTESESAIDGSMDTSPPLPKTCPSACLGHGACNPSMGICHCFKGYDGLSCEMCALGYVGYPGCVPECKLLAHTYIESALSSFDTVSLGGSIKTVPYFCPADPTCTGNYVESATASSLVFTAMDCSKAKFMYTGAAHFICAGLKSPTSVKVVISVNKGLFLWWCSSSEVVYSPSTGAFTVACNMNFTGKSFPKPTVLEVQFLLEEFGRVYSLSTPYKSSCP